MTSEGDPPANLRRMARVIENMPFGKHLGMQFEEGGEGGPACGCGTRTRTRRP